MIIRPLFAYGGEGDMNSLIAKSIYAYINNKQVEMRLDPNPVSKWAKTDPGGMILGPPGRGRGEVNHLP